MRTDPIRVAVVHRDPYVAAGIGALLRSREGFAVVQPASAGAHEDGAAADVIVADHATGLAQAGAGGAASKALLVVTDQGTGWQIRRAIDAGVRGYLLHDCTADELCEAARALAAGRRFLSCTVTDRLLDNLTAAEPTAREQQVLQLIAHGLSNKAIGRRLGIGEGTVKTHVKTLLRKLGESTRTAAIAEALRRGLLLEAG